MSIARKPRSVDEFISGAAVLSETASMVEDLNSSPKIQPVKMRIPTELLNELDKARSQRKPVPSRHQFILEALYEKLDSKKGAPGAFYS